MYLPIGMNIYIHSERIVGIFEASHFHEMIDAAFLQQTTIVEHQLDIKTVKSYIVTTTHEIHWSNVNYRTLKKRWNQLK